MAGDHKCPVCQSTFTRPQHVARHMRSHTGDRPYKCQHCGDQFARSDLLSRHVNKCHSSQKTGAPTQSRRRAQNKPKPQCDQCAHAKVQCNSGAPCTKCATKGITCTYGQPIQQQQVPSMAPPDTLYPYHPASLSESPHAPSLTLSSSTAPSVDNSPPNLTLSQSDFMRRPPNNNFYDLMNPGGGKTQQFYGANTLPYNNLPPNLLSDVFTHPADSDNSSSANSSTHHLPGSHYSSLLPEASLPPQSMVLPQTLYNDHMPVGEGGFSSAFGLMSLDDPAVLAGLPEQSAFFDNHQPGQGLHQLPPLLPNQQHQPPQFQTGSTGLTPSLTPSAWRDQDYAELRSFWNTFMKTPSSATPMANGRNSGNQYPFDQLSAGTSNATGRPSPPRRGLSRVASLPAIKTPPHEVGNPMSQSMHYAAHGNQQTQNHQNHSQIPPAQFHPRQAYNNPEELRAYEQAVLARKAPVLNLSPPKRMKPLDSSSSSIGQRRGSLPAPQSGLAHLQQPPQSANYGYAQGISGTSGSRNVPDRLYLPNPRHVPSAGPSRVQGNYTHHRGISGASAASGGSPVQTQSPLHRPQPKRNASTVLEQQSQKHFRPNDDYGGSALGGTDDEAYSSRSPSISSRPSTSHSVHRSAHSRPPSTSSGSDGQSNGHPADGLRREVLQAQLPIPMATMQR
ncbi:hypothetical protein SISNIDRAFT_466912 [Sistotremastrum niveocremeum HHB9708]|uniref:Zn(2)-C6 fungal-type domain-containing protein n=2 Tax=Sistotremastraceae TaxID=3402574 RepID=A0A164TQP2_9AGAM|nr:hypothetical protein SISNIDRAFT_466912 [Sistotremastrum niveocremeum HHB9708]KZT42229.1 hypothetical protein SISSUDRAFT_1030712 [Sistotremastrum suecicum HHB10207 ss-3]